MRYPGLNALLASEGDPYAPIHGNTFVWEGVTYGVVVQDYGASGKLAWLDRNLGASRAATASDDAQSYGDLYQWGRDADGHEEINRFVGDGKTTSGTTSTLATTDTPGHGDFILAPNEPLDWRDPQNNNLWQGSDGTNNPAPPGWRIPTETEINTERLSWDTNNAAGAFGSALKWPLTGFRSLSNGSLVNVVSHGYYWSSTVSDSRAQFMFFSNQHSNAAMSSSDRANGRSVRCVRTI